MALKAAEVFLVFPIPHYLRYIKYYISNVSKSGFKTWDELSWLFNQVRDLDTENDHFPCTARTLCS